MIPISYILCHFPSSPISDFNKKWVLAFCDRCVLRSNFGLVQATNFCQTNAICDSITRQICLVIAWNTQVTIQSSFKIAPVISIFVSKKVTDYEGLLFENWFDSQLSKIKNKYANKTVVLRSTNHISCYTNYSKSTSCFIFLVFSPFRPNSGPSIIGSKTRPKTMPKTSLVIIFLYSRFFFRFKF